MSLTSHGYVSGCRFSRSAAPTPVLWASSPTGTPSETVSQRPLPPHCRVSHSLVAKGVMFGFSGRVDTPLSFWAKLNGESPREETDSTNPETPISRPRPRSCRFQAGSRGEWANPTDTRAPTDNCRNTPRREEETARGGAALCPPRMQPSPANGVAETNRHPPMGPGHTPTAKRWTRALDAAPRLAMRGEGGGGGLVRGGPVSQAASIVSTLPQSPPDGMLHGWWGLPGPVRDTCGDRGVRACRAEQGGLGVWASAG